MGLADRLAALGLMVRVGPSFATSAEALRTTIGDAEVLCVALARVDAAVLEAAKNLRLIVKCGIGTDNIDLNAAKTHGVMVARTAGVNFSGVAEYVIAAALLHLRKFVELDNAVRQGNWQSARITWAGRIPSLQQSTLGIVGLGTIGREVARLAAAHGMNVLASDPNIEPGTAGTSGAAVVPLSELLRRSDVVTLHVLLDETTHHLIGEYELSLMRPTAMLINTSRGAVVDTAAVVKALRAHALAHAVLDVVEEEPLEAGHPLVAVPNCTLTPHLAGCTANGYAEIGARAAELIALYLASTDLPPDSLVSGAAARS
jgi:phosphoglycerate dehydrogenase-like enzyme